MPSTPWRTVRPYAPKFLGPILILDEIWWNLIVACKKDLEMRQVALKPMKRHVGRSGKLWGTVTLGEAFEVKTDEEWRALRSRHQVGRSNRMHAREMAHTIIAVEISDAPIWYEQMRGQVGTAKYRPPGTVVAPKRPAAIDPAPVKRRRR